MRSHKLPMVMTLPQMRTCLVLSATAIWSLSAQPSFAAETAPVPAIATLGVISRPHNAVAYAVKLQLPEGHGLARALIEIGVNQSDAAAAARLAAGRLGERNGGCEARVELVPDVGGSGLTLERAELLTHRSHTVIERRGAELGITSQQAATAPPRLV